MDKPFLDLMPPLQPSMPTLAGADGMVWSAREGKFAAIRRDLPEEIAVAIMVGKRPAAVVIASPADYEDLGWGFAITEGLGRAADIKGCTIVQVAGGMRVTLDLMGSPAKPRERTLPGRSSCGLCGVSSLEQAIRTMPRVADGGRVAPDVLHAAIEALKARQPLNARTHAVHAAAHVTRDGRITEVREDVGRHNALDKLIGALARAAIDPADGAVLLTSRASYEMVDKAAMAGVRILAAISAPSALALRKAEAAGMTLVGVARHDSFVAFCGEERLGWSAQ